MDVFACLERIGYDENVKRDEATLRGLQRAFLLSVPFENLDIHMGRHIAFTPEAVFRKVMRQNRGGFCYELNSLFHDLLKEIGFDVQFHGASMMRDGRPGMKMGHMVLLVHINRETWLTDVGNGKSTREPLRLDATTQSSAEGVHYRVHQTEAGPALFETGENGQWKARFLIDPEPKTRESFIEACEWTQTSRDSKFTQQRLCTLARANGRVLLTDNKLTVSEDEKVNEYEIPAKEYVACLRSYFGLIIDI
jgi:N-hydroxyarylamine O-acetyltransferase